MPTFVYLVRHGLTEWNALGRLAGRLPGIRLSAQGRQEAEAVAARLASAPLRRVATSPLERARETAERIALRHQLPVEADDAFTEREYVAWQGWLAAEIRARFPDDARAVARGAPVPGVEPVASMAERMAAGVERLTAAHPEEAIVIVSHADPIRALVARIVGMPAGSLRVIAIDTGSLSRIRRRGGVLVADYLNSRTHLDAAGIPAAGGWDAGEVPAGARPGAG